MSNSTVDNYSGSNSTGSYIRPTVGRLQNINLNLRLKIDKLEAENKKLREELKNLYENRFEPDKLHINFKRIKELL